MIELRDQGRDRMADQLARTVLEECPDLSSLEEDMSYAPAERLMTIPTIRDYINKEKAESAAQAAAQAKAEEAAAVARVEASSLSDTLVE